MHYAVRFSYFYFKFRETLLYSWLYFLAQAVIYVDRQVAPVTTPIQLRRRGLCERRRYGGRFSRGLPQNSTNTCGYHPIFQCIYGQSCCAGASNLFYFISWNVPLEIRWVSATRRQSITQHNYCFFSGKYGFWNKMHVVSLRFECLAGAVMSPFQVLRPDSRGITLTVLSTNSDLPWHANINFF